jgi:hypothetical protein
VLDAAEEIGGRRWELLARARQGRDGRFRRKSSGYAKFLCQMVHSAVKPFLAIEWLQPGEGEG